MTAPPTPDTDESLSLPIWERRDDLVDAITQHQVVIVAGETGSGKSTQLPKLLLELDRGTNGRIGHTQPRRIAARSIAERVASELGTEVGGTVGYAVRFTDEVGPDTRIKLMTDGILLAEIQRDRELRAYDTLIIDEAHERSLNIDFLLGYLKRLLPRRPDLKLIVTSATIDTARFSEHFDDAPIIEVTGRTYPVEIGYRPLDDRSLPEGIVDAVTELWRATDGDVLVFCSGERDIRDAAEALEAAELRGAEIFPLYARLSAGEQQRVFRQHRSRRIVLATNVAETSLTVPGIRTVVDPGLARISRYSAKTKVQRLPIEEISQASANQRAGRCGRVAPGVCLRLYEEDDFENRPEFTEPEIQRTNLASVVLQMASLGMGDVSDFPFVEAPEPRNVRDGITLLEELGAIDPEQHQGTKRWLTPIGRTLARLPVDPRLGRMVIEGAEHGCLHEVMVIAAALSVQDPRERPADRREAAAQAHARFANEDSDFLSFVRLWDGVHEARSERSSNQFRRWCRTEFLHFMRIREWQDIYRQLRRVADQLKLRRNREPGAADEIHKALLAGLVSQIGQKQPLPKKAKSDRRKPRPTYLGPRNMRFTLAPGTAASRLAPNWVMAAELVETDQLRARTVGRIDPRWIEDVASHLLSHTYTGAEWDTERGAPMVIERATLHGLPVVAGRRILLDRVNPELAKEIFILHALVEPEWPEAPSPSVERFRLHDFLANNASQLETAKDMAARSRRHDLVVGPEAIYDFYDRNLPSHVTSVKHFNSWWAKVEPESPERLHLALTDLLTSDDVIDTSDFPETWRVGGHDLTLSYEFDATSPIDGLTVDIPVDRLATIEPEPFTWNVQGFRTELVETLIRSLPKELRRSFVPVPETVRQILPALEPTGRSIVNELADVLGRRAGMIIQPSAFDSASLPAHLQPTFRVAGDDGRMLAAGKDLERLKARLDRRAQRTLASERHPIEQDNLVDWPSLPDGRLPLRIERSDDGHKIIAFPALVDRTDHVDLRLLTSEAAQAEAMWLGIRRLLALDLSISRRSLTDRLDNEATLALAVGPYGSSDRWIDDVVATSLDEIIRTAGGPPSTEPRFRALTTWAVRRLPDILERVSVESIEIIRAAHRINIALAADHPTMAAASIIDAREHLDRLHYDGGLTAVGLERLPSIRRYLLGLERRLRRLSLDPRRDLMSLERIVPLEDSYRHLYSTAPSDHDVEAVGWMLEEFRISVFAQDLGTEGPVSEKRIRRALAAAATSAGMNFP